MKLDQTDPEYMERLRHFAFVEVTSEEEQQLESEPRFLAILAALLGCQSTDLYRIMLPKALDSGLSPVAVKEMVYQSTDYLGMGRTWPFLSITNDILEERGISLPLPCQEKQRPLKTAWKRAQRRRQRFLANRCGRHGKKVPSTAGLRQTALVTTIPEPA